MINIDDLPIEIQEYVRELRSESAGYRIERNKLRQELDELQERLGLARPEGIPTLGETYAAARRARRGSAG